MSNPFNTTKSTNGAAKTEQLSESQIVDMVKPMLAAGTAVAAIAKALGPKAGDIAQRIHDDAKALADNGLKQLASSDGRPLRTKVEEALGQGASIRDISELYGNVAGEMAVLLVDNVRLVKAATKAPSRLSMKVSEKGGLSVYGLGRFPVTLYREQWVRLLGHAKEILAFIEANTSTLKNKP